MSMIILSIGTILSVCFILLLFTGQKYNYMLEPLDFDDFPLKSIYTVGLALQDLHIGRLRGKLEDKLKSNISLLYPAKYIEYYARIYWAQALSFMLFSIALFFVLAGLVPEMCGFFAFLGVVLCVLSGYYFLSRTKDRVDTRRAKCEEELPNAISKLALIVNSGVIMHDAWLLVSEGKQGAFYELMQNSCEDMKNGTADTDAIYSFGVKTGSEDIKKFTSALIQSIERGGGELPQFLANQSTELWMHKRQKTLQKGEKAASALLAPIALMFLGIIMIVMSAAMSSFGGFGM